MALGLCISGIYAGATDLYAIPVPMLSIPQYFLLAKPYWDAECELWKSDSDGGLHAETLCPYFGVQEIPYHKYLLRLKGSLDGIT